MPCENCATQIPIIKSGIGLLVFFGFWRPVWWPSKWKFVYHFHGIFVISLPCSLVILQLICIIVNKISFADYAGLSITLITGITQIGKITNILLNKRKIISLIDLLQNNYFKVRNNREIDLQRKFERFHRKLNTSMITLIIVTSLLLSNQTVLSNRNARKLPFVIWVPYSLENEIFFWLTLFYENITIISIGLTYHATVIFEVSIMMYIDVQLKILIDRLIHLAESNCSEKIEYCTIGNQRLERDFEKEYRNRRQLIDCVNHHLLIFKSAEMTQRCFVACFIFQTFASVLAMCSGVYQVIQFEAASSGAIAACLYIICVMFLTFLYCWFGNEVLVKSLGVRDAVYKMNWANLNVSLRKDLLNIFMRANRPILFTSLPVLTLSNSTYMGILKATYTVVTLVKQINTVSSST